MRKKSICITMFAVLLAGVLTATKLEAFSAQPGSAEDPAVTKSYVDEQINKILGMITGSSGTSSQAPARSDVTLSEDDMSELLGEVMSQIEYFYGSRLNSITSESRYSPLEVKAGGVVIGGEGTEIILRSGKATAYSKVENGLVNMTTGADLSDNAEIKANNLIIVPRDDARGVKAVTDCWFMVRGPYRVME